MLKLPHANRHELSEAVFVSSWIVWWDEFGPEDGEWCTGAMPVLAAKENLARQLERGLHFSVDVLCRVLAPPAYRNTMQASDIFLKANVALLTVAKTNNALSGRTVKAVRLSEYAVTTWRTLPQEQRASALRDAWGLLQADLDVENRDKREPNLVNTEPALPLLAVDRGHRIRVGGATRQDLLVGLADLVSQEPFQPYYRRRPYGPAVQGWAARLQSYFWPTPQVTYQAVEAGLIGIHRDARHLAHSVEAGRSWQVSDQALAIDLAERIFRWGRVPQADVTADPVRRVFENALAHRASHRDAPMNSGWTKVAAFATAHLEGRPDGKPQVIWDSRVACSIVSRLDGLLADAGIAEPGQLFPGIGIVPGQGGTRKARYEALRLSWPQGYGRWDSQLAASQLVGELRDVLNADPTHYGHMPLAPGGRGSWTVRGVEMVLFGDGY